jgi:hypothetical protein
VETAAIYRRPSAGKYNIARFVLLLDVYRYEGEAVPRAHVQEALVESCLLPQPRYDCTGDHAAHLGACMSALSDAFVAALHGLLRDPLIAPSRIADHVEWLLYHLTSVAPREHVSGPDLEHFAHCVIGQCPLSFAECMKHRAHIGSCFRCDLAVPVAENPWAHFQKRRGTT